MKQAQPQRWNPDEMRRLGERIGLWIDARRWRVLLALFGVAITIGAFFGDRQSRLDADARAQAQAVAAAASAAALARVTDMPAFERDVEVRLDLADRLMAMITSTVGHASDVESYRLMQRAEEQLSTMSPIPTPASLQTDPQVMLITQEAETMIAVRAAAMRNGMDYLDNRKPSEVIEMQGRLQRASAHAAQARAALAAWQAGKKP